MGNIDWFETDICLLCRFIQDIEYVSNMSDSACFCPDIIILLEVAIRSVVDTGRHRADCICCLARPYFRLIVIDDNFNCILHP